MSVDYDCRVVLTRKWLMFMTLEMKIMIMVFYKIDLLVWS